MDSEPNGSGEDGQAFETGIEIARETMTGDVRDLLLAEIKNAKRAGRPWPKLKEAEQLAIIDRCQHFADDLVARVSRIVAADGRMVINGEVDKVDIKDSKDGALLQARFVTHRSEGSLTALGMAVGKTVSMLIQDIQPFRGERAPASPDPDQPALDLTGTEVADDGMTINKGQSFELPPIADEKNHRVDVTCHLGGRCRIAAMQFGAHSLAMGVPVEGDLSAQHEDFSDANRVTSVIFTAPEASELTGVDFGLALLNHRGDATTHVQIHINYAAPTADGVGDGDPAPQPEDGGDTGGAAPQSGADGDTGPGHVNGSTNGHADEAAHAGEEEAGPTADLAGDPPPPTARGIRRAAGRRRTAH